MSGTAKEYDLPAFYRYKEYTIVVEHLEMFKHKYEGIAYKISHYNPDYVVTGDDWNEVCRELEGLIDDTH